MAEYSTPEERTEMPTERRMGQLRKQGAIFHSQEVAQVASLLSGFMILAMVWQSLLANMKIAFVKSFHLITSTEPLTSNRLRDGFIGLVLLLGPDILFIMVFVAVIASLSVFLQTGFNLKENKIEMKWDMLNPIAGFTRIFSIGGVVNTLKALLKLVIILPLSFFIVQSFAPEMTSLVHKSIYQILAFTGEGMMKLFYRILYILIGFAVFDFVWGKFQWLKNNKMTKDEVKDERKAVEGDEDTKRRIQAKGIQRIMQRIRDSVKKADVVVTNPTHYAVALKYDREHMNAPMVVAKGQGYLAQRIKEIAREAGVPVLERKPLARALYKSVEIGAVIPRELFKAVAEVLAYVYKLKNPYKYANSRVSQ